MFILFKYHQKFYELTGGQFTTCAGKAKWATREELWGAVIAKVMYSFSMASIDFLWKSESFQNSYRMPFTKKLLSYLFWIGIWRWSRNTSSCSKTEGEQSSYYDKWSSAPLTTIKVFGILVPPSQILLKTQKGNRKGLSFSSFLLAAWYWAQTTNTTWETTFCALLYYIQPLMTHNLGQQLFFLSHIIVWAPISLFLKLFSPGGNTQGLEERKESKKTLLFSSC